jgi:hypothetical protein
VSGATADEELMEREREGRLRQSADALQHALDAQRLALRHVAEEDRTRRSDAIDRLAQYVSLLRKASNSEPAFYSFKLVFPDGRWDVEESRLERAPSVGEVVELGGRGRWKIRGSQFVKPRPSQKPAREFFLCAPAA